ncbi:MAG: hypothetical protein H7Y27_07575 [Gemmatimonadaceae bacterium]|nr:hypothetical protein [Chitinophagaceae bacterium]
MQRFIWLALLPFLIFSCKGKKSMTDDDGTVDIEDFMEFFEERPLPIGIGDTTLRKKDSDSLAIAYKTFTQFVPDSLLTKDFGKTVKPKMYSLGKHSVKKGETYLFVKAVAGTKKLAYVLAFDEEDKYVAGMPLVKPDNDPNTQQTSVMDSRLTLTLNLIRKSNVKASTYRKSAYVFNSAGAFTLILEESNEEASAVQKEVSNPIDTQSKKNKFSGDYLQDKMNLISVRDGKNTNEYEFFIHFEKDKGACKGELKGRAKLTGPTKAVYRQPGDACQIEFTFTDRSATIKELEGCGSHRDIRCFFEGRYMKKAAPKAKTPKKAA